MAQMIAVGGGEVPLLHVLLFGLALFVVGTLGVVLRRSALMVLMSIELMLNAANVSVVAFARAHAASSPAAALRGHSMAFLVIAVAAAEAAIGLAIAVEVFRARQANNLDELTLLKG
jgi:NADH-quinone oxidoreductase subunit K